MPANSAEQKVVEPSDVDNWLLGSIHEYLKFSNLHHTAECLESERFTLDNDEALSGPCDGEGGPAACNVRGLVRQRMLRAFTSGKHDNFISLWYTHVPARLLREPGSRMLELNIRVYLTLFHLRTPDEAPDRRNPNVGDVSMHPARVAPTLQTSKNALLSTFSNACPISI
jgi:hypothetical protein